MRKLLRALALCAAAAFLPVPAAYCATISIEFGIGGSFGLSSGLAPSQVAGVVPAANWNVAVGDSGGLSGLVDDAGAGTGAALTWSSNNTWEDPGGFGGPNSFSGANYTLMSAYLDGESGSVPASATISSLPGALYNVYIYSASTETNKQSGGFYINGVHVPGSGTINPGSTVGPNFIQTVPGTAGNYLVLDDVAAVGGSITITDDNTSPVERIPMNGIQLVLVSPEPSTWNLLGIVLGIGGAGIAGVSWRRRRKGA